MTTEIRAWIQDINTTLKKLDNLGCLLKGTYAFSDFIYHVNEHQYNLNQEFMRVRVYEKTNWDQKNVQVVHKKRNQSDTTGQILLKREFDHFSEAETFLKPTHVFAFSAMRTGFEYSFHNLRIFVEDIQFLNPTVEILSPTKEDALSLLKS